jgi:hypothetical protein
MDSVVASDVIPSDRLSGSSKFYPLGFVLAFRFLNLGLAQDFCAKSASFASGFTGSSSHRRGGVSMLLKLIVLSGSAIALWLTPLVALDKKVGWHKSVQGLSLAAAVACAVGGGNIARRLAEENEIEELKTRAVKADVVDEISTSVYVSQAQRQQEAEAILASPGVDVEEARQALEAIYSADLQEAPSQKAELSESDKSLYLEVQKALEAKKSHTWVIENVLKMGGRKFSEGKLKLQSLLSQFEKE